MSKVSTLLLISVGNTRARIGVSHGPGGEFAAASVEPSTVVELVEQGGLEGAITDADVDPSRTRALVATVNEGAVPRIVAALGERGIEWTRLVSGSVAMTGGSGGTGEMRLRVPIVAEVDHPDRVGVDRLLCALAAASRSSGQACAVIDAGTCVTVDLVDGHGVFQGGAIAPGVSMMLRAMHAGTAGLPQVATPRSSAEALWLSEDAARVGLGKQTSHAMTLGALNAVRGLVRWQVEKFAESQGGYPRVIATGGDAPLLFEGDDLVEHVVPDLQLVGMLAAWTLATGEVEAGEDEAGRGGVGDDGSDEE